jgi:hypothetical protein
MNQPPAPRGLTLILSSDFIFNQIYDEIHQYFIEGINVVCLNKRSSQSLT